MRERTKWEITCLVLIFMATMVGLKVGRWNGRAEMKRWQDSYYAGHPVVKEVHSTFTFDTASQTYQCIVNDSTHLVCDGRLFQNTAPAPPKKAKPAKAVKRAPIGLLEWMATSASKPIQPKEIYCDSSVALGDGWLPLTSAPHDGTIVEIAETYGYTPWYDFYQFVDGGWKQASNHAYGLNGEKCGYWRPRKVQPIHEQELILNCAPNFDCNKHSDIDLQGACIVGQEKNRAQDVCCPAYLEVNDCSWHHGTNPRESAKP